MKTTDNLKLNSPELSDAANVLKISENFEKLDKLFETLSVKKSKTAVSEFNSKCCMPYIRFINESEEDITVTDSSAEEETTFTVKAGESYIEWISEASVIPDYSFSAALDINYFVPVADAIESGGGVSDYAELSNKPKINNVELSGNKSLSDIGAGTYSKPTTGIPKTDLSEAVQLSLGRADTALQIEAHTGDYSKPSGGIPKTDLAAAVQNSLSLADTALQTETHTGDYSKPSGGIPSTDMSQAVRESLAKADTALQSEQHTGDYSKPTTGIPKTDLEESVQNSLSLADTALQSEQYKGTYSKPTGGIPKSDLANDIQNSLGLADTALQEHQSLEGYVLTTDSRLSDSRPASDVKSWAKADSKPSYTKSEIGLGNVENKSSATIRSEITSSNVTTALGYTPLNSNLKGSSNGLAELDSSGKIPSSQLPSYVDDVIEKTSKSAFPTTGESGKIYIDSSTNLTYRWTGTAYTEISPSIALGETSSTAYRGDRGKTAYDHSQISTGNPHGTTKSDLGLGNVENKSSETIRSEITKANVTTALGYTPPTTNTTYSDATTSASGLMSASDKTKLNGIASGATANTGTVTSVKVEGSNGLSGSGTVTTTGTITLSNSGVRSITQDSTDGHKLTINTGGTSTTITIPDNNTTYSAATTSAAGLMSSSDKAKLDGIASGANAYSLPTASASTLGGIKVGTNLSISSGVLSAKDTTYSNFVKSGTGAAAGLVPAPSTTAGTTKYLREDGTWQVPPDTNTTYSVASTSANGLMSSSDKTKLNGIATNANNYSHPTTSGNKHIPSGGSSGQILRWSADGTAVWGADNNTTYSSKSAESGGTDVSLCTTGEKYTWNNSVPKLSTADGADYNDFVYTGFYETMGTSSKPTSNSPNGNDTNNDFYVIVQRRGNGYCSQLAISARSDRSIYIRVYDNGTFGDWHKIALKSEIPTKISQLTNDSGYQTALKTVDFKSQSRPSSMSFDSCTFDFAKCVYNSHMVSISIKVSAIHVKDSAKNQNWGNITTLSTIASDIPKPPTNIYGTAYQTGNSTPIYFTIDVSGTLFFITPTSTISNIAESSVIVGSLNYLV